MKWQTLAVYLPINSDKIPFNGSITAMSTPIKTERKLYKCNIPFVFHICNDCIMLKIVYYYDICHSGGRKILITMGMSCKGGGLWRKYVIQFKLAEYMKQNNIDSFFSNDMKPYMELIFFKKNEFICRENEEIDYLFFLRWRKSESV